MGKQSFKYFRQNLLSQISGDPLPEKVDIQDKNNQFIDKLDDSPEEIALCRHNLLRDAKSYGLVYKLAMKSHWQNFTFFLITLLFTIGVFADDIVSNEILSRGEYLYKISGCYKCHTSDPQKPLAGGFPITTTFGVFYTPNISQDKATGIGNWSDKDFLKALREGISPKGEYYYPTFPFTNYTKLTDDDILAIRNYMMTLPSFQQVNQPHQLTSLYKNRKLLFFWRSLYFKTTNSNSIDAYLTRPGAWQNVPNKDAEWNRGAYLIEGPMHCTQCHTPRDNLGGLLTKKWMSGTKNMGESIPNLTPDLKTGLGDWKVLDWENFLQSGMTPQGDFVTGEMHKIVKFQTSQLSEQDKQAVANYFLSLPPVENTEGD